MNYFTMIQNKSQILKIGYEKRTTVRIIHISFDKMFEIWNIIQNYKKYGISQKKPFCVTKQIYLKYFRNKFF